MAHTGGCNCGQVKYAFEEHSGVGNCHCTVCQRQSGAPFSVNVLTDETDFHWTAGEPAVYVTVGEDSKEKVQRYFCKECGSPLASFLDEMPGVVAVKAGTLDDSTFVEPEMDVFTSSKQSWVTIPEDRGQFPRGLSFE